jgi:hypothetical protein
MQGHTAETIDQIKSDAERITKSRLENDGIGAHAAREAEVNAMQGVTDGTPVLEAAKANPSEPGLANFQTAANHQGPANVHATGEQAPTDESVKSAEQAKLKGTDTTKEPGTTKAGDKS